MTTKKFDATPTATESMNLDDISSENVKQAWQAYEAKPEYKHDLIESMQGSAETQQKS